MLGVLYVAVLWRLRGESMDRLLSEQKILEAIDNLKVNFTCYDSVTLDEVASHVKAIPSAEPKPGQWILLDECSNSGYYCSECHKKVVKEGWSNTVKKIKYCPNCGAMMVEPQKSEDKE